MENDEYLDFGEPSFAVEDSGTAHVVYSCTDWATGSINLRYAVVRGSDIAVSTLARYVDASSASSVVRIDSAGCVHILCTISTYVYEQIWDTSIVYYNLSDAGLVSTDLTDVLSLNLQNSERDFSVDASGKVHMALVDFSNNLYYVTNLGGSWTKELIDCVGNAGGAPSVAVSDSGTVYISYVNRTDYLEYYYTLRCVTNAGGSWTTIDVFEGDVFPSTTSIALDSTGHVFIGCLPDWVDSENYSMGTLGYATNLNGPFELFRTSFLGGVSGTRWFSIDRDGNAVLVYNGSRVSTGTVLSNVQWVTEAIPGGTYVEEDEFGHLHTFYGLTEWFSEWPTRGVAYASDKYYASDGPASIEVSPGSGGATLRWTAPEDSGGLPVLKYQIFHGTDQDQMTLFATVGPSVNSYTFANLSSSSEHYFSVFPVTLVGVGANSSIVSATPLESPNPEPVAEDAYGTLVVIGATVAVAATAVFLLIRRSTRRGSNRKFAVPFICFAVAFTALLPAYFADTAWNAEQATWTMTTLYEGILGVNGVSLALDADGYGHVAASSHGGLLYSTNISGTWMTTVIGRDLHAADVSIAVDADGAVHIAFLNNTFLHPYAGVLSYATNRGGNWTFSVVDDSYSTRCWLTLGPEDDVHIGYSTTGYPAYDAKHAVKNGDSWEIETVESNHDMAIWMGNIAVSGVGEVMLAYEVGDEARYASWADGNWTLTNLGEGCLPMLFLDSSDVPHICYTLDGSFSAAPAVYAIEDYGTWSLRELGFSALSPLPFAMDSVDNLRIVFRDEYLQSKLYLAEGGYANLTLTTVMDVMDVPLQSDPFIVLSVSGEPVICASEYDSSGRISRLVIIEKDLSDFTLSERMGENWARAQADVLAVWMIGEALIVLAFGMSLRLGWWRGKGPPESEDAPGADRGRG